MSVAKSHAIITTLDVCRRGSFNGAGKLRNIKKDFGLFWLRQVPTDTFGVKVSIRGQTVPTKIGTVVHTCMDNIKPYCYLSELPVNDGKRTSK